MRNFFAWVSACYAGGLLGGLVGSFVLYLAGAYKLLAVMDVALAPQWTLAWLYPRLVWGGAWGLLLAPRWMADSILLRGICASLGPTLFELLIVYPNVLDKGVWGLELGTLTPVVVIAVNIVWGITTATWVRLADDSSTKGYGRLR
jgi:hypothetical protein